MKHAYKRKLKDSLRNYENFLFGDGGSVGVK